MAEKKLTKLGKEIIPTKLLGKNPAYETIMSPRIPEYPNGYEVSYSDDFLSALNESYPLRETLGGDLAKFLNTHGIERITMGSPLKNNEGEKILRFMLKNSTESTAWQPLIISFPGKEEEGISQAKEYLDNVSKVDLNQRSCSTDRGTLYGIARAKKGKFAHPLNFKNKVLVIPSQDFVEYLSGKN